MTRKLAKQRMTSTWCLAGGGPNQGVEVVVEWVAERAVEWVDGRVAGWWSVAWVLGVVPR